MDLNLLRYLVVLVQECSVSRAADRVFVTQPAMSAALKRLREAFNDPILVRSGQSMSATPRARELIATVEPMLLAVHGLTLRQPVFEPRRSRHSFHFVQSVPGAGLERYTFNYNPTPPTKSTLISSPAHLPTLCLHHEGLPRLE
jgi:DNA-binding transcriptional LysR family regulator